MRNILEVNLLWMAVLFFASSAHAGVSESLKELAKPVVNVTETSRPIFSEDQTQEETRPADPFFVKQRQKRSDFLQEQIDRRKKFYTKLKRKELDPQARQKKLSEFRKKEMEKTQEFLHKQNQQLQKHFKE